MCFRIRYFRNPIERTYPSYTEQGIRYLNQGMRCIKRKIRKPKSNINVTRNAKHVIKGFAYLFGFRYQSFLLDNFDKKTKYTYCRANGKRCTLKLWCIILPVLNQELKQIQSYPNLSRLLRSRYAKYISIADIKKYYHPRKKHYVHNARKKLAKLGNNKRYQFCGTFKRMGSKPNGQLTVLLVNITYYGQKVTNHLWFNFTKQFKKIGYMNAGDKILFTSRVREYKKGYLRKTFIKHYDYNLIYPTDIKRLQ